MHLCRNLDHVWMVQHGQLLHRARGLTRFLTRICGATKDKCGDSSCPSQQAPTPVLAGDPVRCAQNDNLEGISGRGEGCAGFFNLSYQL